MDETTWSFPLPDPDDATTLPHFEGLQDKRILVQACARCHKKRWYPKPACHACWSLESYWAEIPSNGVVHTWTRIHHPYAPAKPDDVPYQVVIVEIVDGIRVVGRFPMELADDLHTGLSVQAEFHEVSSGATLLYFVPEIATL